MSIMNEARDFVINGGDFRVQYTSENDSIGIDILRGASTPEAAIDAEERSYAPSCYPGTRDQYIDDITTWAAAGGSYGAQPIYWMKGPAGVGKSAIAQTCAAKLKDAGQLGAAFFFSINGRRKDHTRFFPTLAYQLSTIYHDYRFIINRKISIDQTLVKKTMSAQFQSLIVEPLQELKEQGKELPRKAIFIDGLDECETQNAQVEIIRIVASSVRTASTPFRWAIFSREEPQIVSTFADPNISSLCYSVFLPISRKADEEIEIYLRSGFRNILQRRNLLHLSSSWPTEEDIRKLVDAAAGLFAYSAIALRFIDHHSYSGFKESLEAVLASFANLGTNSSSLYAELDKLYTLIFQRVPRDIFPTMLLLLSHMARYDFAYGSLFIAPACNVLGISEVAFQGVYHHLQAVLTIQDPPQSKYDKSIILERSFFEQDSTFDRSLYWSRLQEVQGTVDFHHKSFYDFITDPTRSSTFCVTAPPAREMLFNRYIQQHSLYASSYVVQGSKLIPAPGVENSSVSLSWPQGSEFVNSLLKIRSFNILSLALSHDDQFCSQLLQDITPSSLHQLTELDYRKDLIADQMINGLGLRTNADIAGYDGVGDVMRTDCSMFSCIVEDKFDVFDPVVFLRTVEKLEQTGVIRPYNPRLGSSRAASLLHTFSRPKPYGRSFGRYKIGHGDRSVIWYWEFDTKERYFHEFRTVKFKEAMAYYKAERFKIWEWGDEDYIGSNEENDEGSDKESRELSDEDNHPVNTSVAPDS